MCTPCDRHCCSRRNRPSGPWATQTFEEQEAGDQRTTIIILRAIRADCITIATVLSLEPCNKCKFASFYLIYACKRHAAISQRLLMHWHHSSRHLSQACCRHRWRMWVEESGAFWVSGSLCCRLCQLLKRPGTGSTQWHNSGFAPKERSAAFDKAQKACWCIAGTLCAHVLYFTLPAVLDEAS